MLHLLRQIDLEKLSPEKREELKGLILEGENLNKDGQETNTTPT